MRIVATDAGKRFNRDWIFRHFNYTFQKGVAYAITGPNGSGKSTLLQVLSGSMYMNEGSLRYEQLKDLPADNRKPVVIPTDQIYPQVSYCAPYLEVIEEMTLKEFLAFHQGFKPFLPEMDIESIIGSLGLQKAAGKEIRYYSSGMKQRVKLAQCIFSDTSIVLLDEPCTNLDAEGIQLYHRLIADHCANRLVVVSSNDKVEYEFCQEVINIRDFS
jgi:ABC-type multidrug transport system ATPase subunit